MNTGVTQKAFNKRAFLSTILLLSGSILPVSGIMNHELQFEALTPIRHFWMSVHNMAALLFSVSVIMHLSMNWRPMLHYLKSSGKIYFSKETITAFVLIVGIVSLFALHAFHVG